MAKFFKKLINWFKELFGCKTKKVEEVKVIRKETKHQAEVRERKEVSRKLADEALNIVNNKGLRVTDAKCKREYEGMNRVNQG